ncbi:MAG: hypothetical protein CVT49_06815 [candidate division Zixibacteria bacterium HGW-Zixibacteria-1]|nr:MAG: hypothetical protein CVT49_06815 [candidate division Zixibacteria bacterium HGW-Zixibacteria-1]
MKSLKFLPFLAVLVFLFFAPPVSGFYDPQRIEIPIIYQGDDHPWGGEVDPNGGGSVNRTSQSGGTLNSGGIFFLDLIRIIWVPDFYFDRSSDSGQKSESLLPGTFNENQVGNSTDGRGVR